MNLSQQRPQVLRAMLWKLCISHMSKAGAGWGGEVHGGGENYT